MCLALKIDAGLESLQSFAVRRVKRTSAIFPQLPSRNAENPPKIWPYCLRRPSIRTDLRSGDSHFHARRCGLGELPGALAEILALVVDLDVAAGVAGGSLDSQAV